MKPSPTFPTDYASILQRIHSIDPLRYGKTRNFLDGAVTYLSPYISRGVISTRQVYEAVMSRGYTLHQVEKFVSELAWRDYFQQVWVSREEAIFDDLKQAQPDAAHRHQLKALENATTGIHALDHGIQQLYETGYMHNHLRMYTASVACNIGKAHWKEPAAWLYYHLMDGDLASNSLSWQWVAGAFSSKKYYCNQENINKYTGTSQRKSYLDNTYDLLPTIDVPDALKDTMAVKRSTPLPQTETPRLYPEKRLLLYNSYQLDPNWHQNEDANRVLLLEPSHFDRFPVSQKLVDFVLALAKNIRGIQVFVGEVDELVALLPWSKQELARNCVSKEHPAFRHYPGMMESRDWLAPEVRGYFPSFFAFWKKASRHL